MEILLLTKTFLCGIQLRKCNDILESIKIDEKIELDKFSFLQIYQINFIIK